MSENEKPVARYDNDNQPAVWGPHPLTAKDAKRLGAKYYFNGSPCKRGHIAPRYAHGSCTACKAEDRANNSDSNKIAFKIWRANNPDKTKGYHDKAAASGYRKLYYSRTKEKQLADAALWRKENPEDAAALDKKYREANRDEINARAREKYKENPEPHIESGRIWRRANKDKHALNSRRWRKNNPEKSKIMDRNKKLRRKGSEGSHTLADVEAILQRQKYKCLECNKSVRKEYHVDHFMPIALGGTNWPHNLQVLCPTCNMEKHATHPLDWARKKGRLV